MRGTSSWPRHSRLGTGTPSSTHPRLASCRSTPPGFPVLLSLVFRIAPCFPENVPLLKAVSILAMAGVALLTMQHCRRDQGLTSFTAWAIALATAVHPAFVFLATSTVMSECV